MKKILFLLLLIYSAFVEGASLHSDAHDFQNFACANVKMVTPENEENRTDAWWHGYCAGYIDSLLETYFNSLEKKYGKNCKTQYYSFYNMENIPLNQYTVRFVSFIKANKFTWDLKTPQAFSYFMEMTYSVDPVCKKSKKLI
jgi:hypothetical protein